ncbi:hypothetical protein BS78_10G005900 [Paspalum vaginatum]|nr:hypothetical protein BS78_10G005900 [Paspalum vaginatum]
MTSSTLLLVLLCLCTASSSFATSKTTEVAAPATEDLVATACANATADKCIAYRFAGPGLTRESCQSALRSEKRSAAAKHPRDLALIALHLLLNATAAAHDKVDDALRSTQWDKGTAISLHFCQVEYDALASTVRVCRALVHEYSPDADADHTRSRSRSQQNEEEDSVLPLKNEECSIRLRNRAAKCWSTLNFENQFISEPLKKAVWKAIDEATSRANLVKAMVEQMVGGIIRNPPDRFYY